MSANGRFRDIARDDLMGEAERFGVRRPRDLLAGVRGVVEDWPRFAREAGLSRQTAELIAADLKYV